MSCATASPSSVSPAKLKANQLNALKSTGPKTPAGKDKSSRNAMTFGLFSEELVLPGESLRDFHLLREGLLASLCPIDLAELILVERIICANWKLRRIQLAESQILAQTVDQWERQLQQIIHRHQEGYYDQPEESDPEQEFEYQVDEEEEDRDAPMSLEEAEQMLEEINHGQLPQASGSLLYRLEDPVTQKQMEVISHQEQRLDNLIFRAMKELQRMRLTRLKLMKEDPGYGKSCPYLTDSAELKDHLDEIDPEDEQESEQEISKMKNEATEVREEDKLHDKKELSEKSQASETSHLGVAAAQTSRQCRGAG